MLNLHYKKLWLSIACFWVILVIYLSLIPSVPVVGVKISDKLSHMFAYAWMMAWFIQIYQNLKHKNLLAILLIAMGILLEYLQGWMGTRYFEYADMLANASGVALVWIVSFTRFSTILYRFEVKFLK